MSENVNIESMSDNDFERYMSSMLNDASGGGYSSAVDTTGAQGELQQEQQQDVSNPLETGQLNASQSETHSIEFERDNSTPPTIVNHEGSIPMISAPVQTESTNQDKVEIDPYDISDIVARQTYLKVQGQNVPMTIQEIKELARKGLDYTKKTQALAEKGRLADAVQTTGVSLEEIKLIADVKKGNKDAVTALIKQFNIDPFELDLNKPVDYKPQIDIKSEQEARFEEVRDAIIAEGDQDSYNELVKLTSQLDNKSADILYANPEMIEALYGDIKSGVYKTIMPYVIKAQVLGDKTPAIEIYKKLAIARDKVIEEHNEKQIPIQTTPIQQQKVPVLDTTALDRSMAALNSLRQGIQQQVNERDIIARREIRTATGATGYVPPSTYGQPISSARAYLDSSSSDEDFSARMEQILRNK